MNTWYLVIDVEKCEGCNNCFMACKDEHVGNNFPGYSKSQPDHGQRWINISTNVRGQYPFVDAAYLPAPCMHCDNAPCIKAAKDKSVYKRDDGIVVIDPDKAKGQKGLVAACPYGSIWWNEELETPQKCTFCANLLDQRWKEPRCVQACPTGALSIRHVDAATMKSAIENEKLEVLHPEYKTKPRVYYKNLYMYTKCFIGGSIAVSISGITDCTAGARISLFTPDNNKIGECVTDNFGDFKFDNLAENSGKYSILIEHNNYPPKRFEVELNRSVYTGTLFLEQA